MQHYSLKPYVIEMYLLWFPSIDKICVSKLAWQNMMWFLLRSIPNGRKLSDCKVVSPKKLIFLLKFLDFDEGGDSNDGFDDMGPGPDRGRGGMRGGFGGEMRGRGGRGFQSNWGSDFGGPGGWRGNRGFRGGPPRGQFGGFRGGPPMGPGGPPGTNTIKLFTINFS